MRIETQLERLAFLASHQVRGRIPSTKNVTTPDKLMQIKLAVNNRNE